MIGNCTKNYEAPMTDYSDYSPKTKKRLTTSLINITIDHNLILYMYIYINYTDKDNLVNSQILNFNNSNTENKLLKTKVFINF